MKIDGDKTSKKAKKMIEILTKYRVSADFDTPLTDAIDELMKHDELTLIGKLLDYQHPKWERLLRALVNHLNDKTVRF